MLPYIPNFSPEYLPINNPIKVKDAAQILKITPDKITLFVIAVSPKPVEKLSKLTEIAIKNILNKLSSNIFSSFFNKLIIISMPINKRIIPNNKLTFIFKKVIIFVPNIDPRRGIKKCIIPTNKDKNNILFLHILNVPIDKQTEKVSIDKETPIINNEITIDTFIT